MSSIIQRAGVISKIFDESLPSCRLAGARALIDEHGQIMPWPEIEASDLLERSEWIGLRDRGYLQDRALPGS